MAATEGMPPPAPFIVGVSRSGTTLLRLMLDAHPLLAIPPETHFIPRLLRECKDADDPRRAAFELITTHRRWDDFHLDAEVLEVRFAALDSPGLTQLLRCFYLTYAEREGKPRWGDKSPPYLRRMRRISAVLPEARFVHLIRDGRDVALSLIEVEWGPSRIDEAARKWVGWIERARRQSRRIEHYLEVRYEELVSEPEPVLRRVCGFVELDFDPSVLAHHERAEGRIVEVAREFQIGGDGPLLTPEDRARQHRMVADPPRTDRVGRWRTEMSPGDRRDFEAVAGPLLDELGYPRD